MNVAVNTSCGSVSSSRDCRHDLFQTELHQTRANILQNARHDFVFSCSPVSEYPIAC